MASSATERVLRGAPRFDNASANALRALAMDAVQAAISGHPGAPMGMAEVAQHLGLTPAALVALVQAQVRARRDATVPA